MRVEGVAGFSRSRMAFRSGGFRDRCTCKKGRRWLSLFFWAVRTTWEERKKRDKNKTTQVRSGLICAAWAENGGRRREEAEACGGVSSRTGEAEMEMDRRFDGTKRVE